MRFDELDELNRNELDELSREVCVGVQLKSLIKVLVGSRLQYQGRR